jgi:hypothetical protein
LPAGAAGLAGAHASSPLPRSDAELVFDGFNDCHEDPQPGIDPRADRDPEA